MYALPRSAYLVLTTFVLSACASAPRPKPIVSYQQVMNVNAREVASQITKSYPVATDFDARTNTVILAGRPDAVAAARAAIDKMDAIPADYLIASVFFIRKLKNANAAEVAALMQQMNPKEYHVAESTAPRELSAINVIIVDPKTNSLLITADFADQQKTRDLIDRLDEILKSD